MRWFLTAWFLFFIVLGAASFDPGIVFFTFIFTIGIGGLIMIAANTVLLYSIAFLPALFAFRRRDGGVGERRRRTLLALAIPAIIAVAPGPLSILQAKWFARTMDFDDFQHLALGKPKTLEIANDNWDYPHSPGEKPLCNDVCQRLLFNREVDRVRMVNLPRPSINYQGDVQTTGKPFGITYSVAKQVSCPEANLPRNFSETAVHDRLVTGECLIAVSDDQSQADVQVAETTLYAGYFEPVDPRIFPRPNVSPPWPLRTSAARIRRLTITQRDDAGVSHPIMKRTESKLEALAIPFYFGHHVGIPPNVVDVGPNLGRRQFAVNSIDVAQILKTNFGFRLDPVPPIDPTAAAGMLEQILSSPTKELFTTQQSTVINDALSKLLKGTELSDADIVLIRRVIADARVNDGLVGVTLLNLFRKFPRQLEPSIGQVLDRLAIPIPQQVGHYKSSLSCALQVYSRDTLEPYHEQVARDRQLQPDWTTECLLKLL